MVRDFNHQLLSFLPFAPACTSFSRLGFATRHDANGKSEPKILSQMDPNGGGFDGDESHGIPIHKRSPTKQIQCMVHLPCLHLVNLYGIQCIGKYIPLYYLSVSDFLTHPFHTITRFKKNNSTSWWFQPI